MEQEDANLRELLLLHGHLPAEVATITTRTSTDFSSMSAAAAAAVVAATNNTSTTASGGILEDGSTVNGGGSEVQGSECGDGIDWISKLDFLEFCMATVDIIQYSIV